MDKIFVGNGKVISTQYGKMAKISFSKDDINRMVSYMKQENSDWINCVLKEKREKKEGKPTHYLEVDQWKPEPSNSVGSQNEPTPKAEPDDLPF